MAPQTKSTGPVVDESREQTPPSPRKEQWLNPSTCDFEDRPSPQTEEKIVTADVARHQYRAKSDETMSANMEGEIVESLEKSPTPLSGQENSHSGVDEEGGDGGGGLFGSGSEDEEGPKYSLSIFSQGISYLTVLGMANASSTTRSLIRAMTKGGMTVSRMRWMSMGTRKMLRCARRTFSICNSVGAKFPRGAMAR